MKKLVLLLVALLVRAVDRRASTQLLVPRHAMWTQAPRFESIPGWA